MKLRTRDGRDATIVATSLENDDGRPVVALVGDKAYTYQQPFGSSSTTYFRRARGKGPDDLDLLMVPERTVEFYNFYPQGFTSSIGIESPKVSDLYAAAADAFGGRAEEYEVVTLKVTREEGKLISVELVPDA
jgi:hypothetical protein